MSAIAQKLSQAGTHIERWLPKDFDLATVWNSYERMAAYINNYAQPKDLYNVRRSLTLGDRPICLIPMSFPVTNYSTVKDAPLGIEPQITSDSYKSPFVSWLQWLVSLRFGRKSLCLHHSN